MEFDTTNKEVEQNQDTGYHEELENNKIVIFPFDKYLIKVRLTQANEFIDIIEVKINRDFLSYKQKITPKGFHDVEKFYRDETD